MNWSLILKEAAAFVVFMVSVVFVFFVLGGQQVHAECVPDGMVFEVGIGAHNPAIDGPEYITQNPLGIAAVRYYHGPFVYALEHTSSLEGFPKVFDSPNEHGYGANVLSVRYQWRP